MLFFPTVPWTVVSPLVKIRSVQLLGGEAKVECHHACHLLCCPFKTLHNISYTQLHRVFGDLKDEERTADVMRNIYKLYKNNLVGNILTPINIKYTEIEKKVQYFPLCMLKLHNNLKMNNRLNHMERYTYSLYLKDIGLSLEENLVFWESFYTKPHSSTGGCQHDWGKSKRRYTYSIRHMYGLEGHRVNRASHSCSALQVGIILIMSMAIVERKRFNVMEMRCMCGTVCVE